jgi:hypothetical protein
MAHAFVTILFSLIVYLTILLYLPRPFSSVATAILGGYFGLFMLYKIKSAFSSSPPAVEAAPVAVSSTSAGSIPDIDSEEFGAFLESEENVNKLVESWEK